MKRSGKDELAAAFTYAGVAEAYQHRPPYPPDVFDTLEGLITDEPRVVLDLGAGEGALARTLAPRVDRVDALDVSAAMVEAGRRRPGGGHPHLRWIVGPAESAPLSGPYALVVAGASLHWMPWERTLARLRAAMRPGAFLAIVEHGPEGAPWQQELGRIIARHSRAVDYDPEFSVVDELASRGLWEPSGRFTSRPLIVRQPVAAYVEHLHSTASLAREWMPPEEAAELDAAVTEVVQPYAVDGELELSVVAHVAWGRPTPNDPSPSSP